MIFAITVDIEWVLFEFIILLDYRLNAGWSVHTEKMAVKKDPQLTEAELIEIQKVIERSQHLERTEQRRVL